MIVHDLQCASIQCCSYSPSSEDPITRIAASVCCQRAAILSGNLASSDGSCCRETCFKCVPASGDGPKTVTSGFMASEGNEQGVDLLLPMSRYSSSYNSNMREEIIKSRADVLTVLLLALHPGTWSGIIDERLKAEFQSLVSTDDLPDVLKREVCYHNPSVSISVLFFLRLFVYFCTVGKCFPGKEDAHIFSYASRAKF